MKFPKTSSSESPSGRARQRARPVALADRSVSPGEAKHRDSPKLNGDLEEHFPVSLSNAPRGSLRSVLEDVDLPELPCSPTGSTGPPVRTSHTMPGARPRIRALSALSSDLSMKTDHLGLERPESPTLVREDFRHSLAAGVAVIFFDFDGTLTATPGDRAARRTKQLELCERAPMLAPRLKSLCADGASLGIISKSTEGTIRSALEASDLAKFFDAPLVAKAVGFEGKAGFIEDLALNGCLPRLGSIAKHGVPFSRILLVDDDLLELERAKTRGIQVYAAPEDGGLQDEDFDAISEALRIPRPRSHPSRGLNLPTAETPGLSAAGRRLSRCRSAVQSRETGRETRPLRLPSIGRSRNRAMRPTRILFSGDCYDCFGDDFTATSEGSRMTSRRVERSSLSE